MRKWIITTVFNVTSAMLVKLILVFSLFCVFTFPQPAVGEQNSNTCAANFYPTQTIQLCHEHHKTENEKHYQCEEQQGFVLNQLVIAPETKHSSCGPFHNNDLLDAVCLRQAIFNRMPSAVSDIDQTVINILESISGKNQFNSSTLVRAFHFPNLLEETEEIKNITSAYVAFESQCRSVNSEVMINMCKNQTVRGNRLYITLRDIEFDKIPGNLSMCQCLVRPVTNFTKDVHITPLDVRLQSKYANSQCGWTSLTIEETNGSGNNKTVVGCLNQAPLYGLSELFHSKSEEIVLTLANVSSTYFPASVWIEIKKEYKEEENMEISCSGFMTLSLEIKKITENETQELDEPASDDGNLVIILTAVAGFLGIMIVVIIILICFARRRHSDSYDIRSTLIRCCRRSQGEKQVKSYKPVSQADPIYSEPGNPRPSLTNPPYTFPADSKFRFDKDVEYAAPESSDTLALTAHTVTPPPIPESLPPASPSSTSISLHDPPEKPIRIFKAVEETEEEYDHINSGSKFPLKSPPGRDRQNNIIGGVEDVSAGIYDHLRQGESYSEIDFNPNLKVKDNIYDTTS